VTLRSPPPAAVAETSVRRAVGAGTAAVAGEIRALVAAKVDDPSMRHAIGYQLVGGDIGPEMTLLPELVLLCFHGARRSSTDLPAGDGEFDDGPAVAFAAAVELAHHFIVIHDDLEYAGRGRPDRVTMASQIGVAKALNIGDALHSLAYASLAGVAAHGVDDRRVTELAAGLARAVVAMATGTPAALTACATSGAALLALGNKVPAARHAVANYREFGGHFGAGLLFGDKVLSSSCPAAPARSRVELHARQARNALVTAAGGADALVHNRYLSTLDRLVDVLTSRIRPAEGG
jgi:hypothetical protein